ncbi:MAG: hypothetical protein ACRDMU_11335 [Gaiellaceae bacterium]
MADDRIRDPGLRWVESGVSGLARPRQWDATSLAEVPALRGYAAQVEFRVRADGSVVGEVPPEAVPALTAELGLDPPYTVRAVRRSDTAWAVGVLIVHSEPIDLPGGIDAVSLEVAVPPEGDRMLFADGELVEEPAGGGARAFEDIERAGRARFQAFVARADRVEDGRWELTVDPL